VRGILKVAIRSRHQLPQSQQTPSAMAPKETHVCEFTLIFDTLQKIWYSALMSATKSHFIRSRRSVALHYSPRSLQDNPEESTAFCMYFGFSNISLCVRLMGIYIVTGRHDKLKVISTAKLTPCREIIKLPWYPFCSSVVKESQLAPSTGLGLFSDIQFHTYNLSHQHP
jgi:hypothetical protein